ncbi:protein ALP1-like [Senna tora]|uniref:Protein ALP1-like n=1 Tax=Senna tora TaxID=362788 RepID=A0A834WCN4_9FABA|nr:protein ALP1-like [Senna tora]
MKKEKARESLFLVLSRWKSNRNGKVHSHDICDASGGKARGLEKDNGADRTLVASARRFSVDVVGCISFVFSALDVTDELARQTDEEIVVRTVIVVVALYNILMHETLRIGLRRNRLRGRSFTLEFHEKKTRLRSLVYSNESSCYNVLRMYRNTFDRLCSMLDEIGVLKPTKHMLVDEQVTTCLNILAHHTKNRVIPWNFGRTGFYIKVQPRSQRIPLTRGGNGSRCTGWHTCKGKSGSERANTVSKSKGQSDSRVLKSVLKQYYLVDGGYSNAQGFLASFRGQRYHLNEWRQGRHPTNPRECFNMRHSAA